MTEEIKIRQTARASSYVVDSGQRAGTGRASARRRTERLRREVTSRNARENLLIEMLPLAKRIALKIREHLPTHVEVDDLISDAYRGLVDSVARFDARKRTKLGTYARHRVRGAILDGLRAADPATRDLRRKNKEIHELYRELEAKVRRPVHDEEMATAAGMTLTQWHRALNEVQSAGFDCGSRVLSAGPTFPRQSTDPELLVDGSDDPFEICYRRQQRKILSRALCRLRQRERQILNLYYRHELTMKQIADRMGVDESRISQLHSTAIARLKTSVNSLLQPRNTEISPSGSRSMVAGAGA